MDKRDKYMGLRLCILVRLNARLKRTSETCNLVAKQSRCNARFNVDVITSD